MSNHAVYVMSAYLVALVILGGLLISSLAARRRASRVCATNSSNRRAPNQARSMISKTGTSPTTSSARHIEQARMVFSSITLPFSLAYFRLHQPLGDGLIGRQ